VTFRKRVLAPERNDCCSLAGVRARKLEVHDIIVLERFESEVIHMIMSDVFLGELSIGDKKVIE